MSDEVEQKKKTRSQKRTGIVASISGDKTIRVTVDALAKHPMYGKYIRRCTHLCVHDPGNEARVGDVVEIVLSRRISKRKSWRLGSIVRRGILTADIPGKGQ